MVCLWDWSVPYVEHILETMEAIFDTKVVGWDVYFRSGCIACSMLILGGGLNEPST